MLKRFAAFLFVLPFVTSGLYAQGLDTQASKDDWEEINFEFNSSVLVDGYPSLLRLAELLQKHPGYKVKVEGHTDTIGGGDYNEKLGLARANSVRDFLVKYGASPNQISVGTRGKVDPKYPGQKQVFTKTDEPRWMNRRVVITAMDEGGRMIGAGGAGDAIRAIEPAKGGMTDCCAEVLRRLDKLDDLARMLKDLADQNAAMRKEIASLKQGQQVLESKSNVPQPAMMGPMTAAAPPQHDSRFQLLGINIGANQDGSVTFTGKGRFFGPFAEHYAFQAEGEYLYTKGQREGQLDFGLVDRIGRFQAGLFASFKNVGLAGNQSSGTLGQASLTMDYIFKWGRVGVFGTQGFLNNATISSNYGVNPMTGATLNDILIQRYLRVVDQAGVSGAVGLWGENYLEGNLGYLKSVGYGDRVGGTVRLVFPLNTKIAVTVEGGMNETMIGSSNNGRAVVGLLFGNALRPKEFLGVDHPVPVDVPRVRYEVLTRRLRIGHTPPVADAGPDQIGVPAGTITLNGSNSYSPDGDPLTYQWVQESGPSVSLSASTSPVTSYTAAASQAYAFRLTVRDNFGGQASARVHITTKNNALPQVLSFSANPTQIQSGQSSTLSWRVMNADTVTISSIGNVALVGSNPVAPTVTTTYTLTATNKFGTDSATAVVVVTTPQTGFQYCYASPSNIMLGESATLNYQANNATSVSISPSVGTVGLSGTVAVTPTTSTTYTLTATGPSGPTTCSIAVNVTLGSLPRIVQFSAAPMTIFSGQSSTLLWVVDNATSVTISTLGTVVLAGTQKVTPAQTTTYTLTATNQAGSVTAQATVTVNQIPPPTIISFTATPPNPATPGSPVRLVCTTSNTASITMNGLTFLTPIATYTVYPTTSTTYTCIATGQQGASVSATAAVTVASVPPPKTTPPTIVIAGGSSITSAVRTVLIDASGSTSPSGNTPLTFSLHSLYNSATIINGNTATPTVTVGPQPGMYYFNLTVTDSKGNSSTQEITLKFLP